MNSKTKITGSGGDRKMIGAIVIARGFEFWRAGLLLAVAQTNSGSGKSPVTVLNPGSGSLPAPIETLLTEYQSAREKYLAQRQALLDKLKGATGEQRQQIRAQLQADQAAFLAQVAALRQQLRQEISALQLKIHNAELNRLINSGSGGQGGGGHKGH